MRENFHQTYKTFQPKKLKKILFLILKCRKISFQRRKARAYYHHFNQGILRNPNQGKFMIAYMQLYLLFSLSYTSFIYSYIQTGNVVAPPSLNSLLPKFQPFLPSSCIPTLNFYKDLFSTWVLNAFRLLGCYSWGI